MSDIKALIARVRELDKAATPGPWEYAACEFENNNPENVRLTCEYRTAAPLLAEALEIAMGALEHIYQIDEDPGIEHIAFDALARIAKLGEK